MTLAGTDARLTSIFKVARSQQRDVNQESVVKTHFTFLECIGQVS